MRPGAWIAAGLAAVAAIVAAALWLMTEPRPVAREIAQAVAEPGDAAAGRSVFFLAGCPSCHMSPGQTDPLKLGGGLELKTPFGSFFPPNISSDPDHGVGRWSAADFANALMAGTSPAGGHFYPAFPYPSYRRMALKDVRDLIAFLKTVPAVQDASRPQALAFPFSVRRAIGLWKLLFLAPLGSPPETAPADPEGRGRYLVEGPGHCAECHSPRGWLGEVIAARRLTGGPLPDGKGKAPNITASGLKTWSESDIADALTTGFTPEGDVIGGAMAEVVRNLSQAPPEDVKAIARFLKTYEAGQPW